MKKNKPTFAYIGSDGGLEIYDDPYFEVTPETVEAATMYEDRIIQTRNDLTRNFVKLGYYLDEFHQGQYYKAKGYPDFNTWLRSPEIDISSSQAFKLIQIKKQIIPLLMEKLGIDEAKAIEKTINAGVSKLGHITSLVPMGYTDEVVQLTEESPHLTMQDLQLKVKSLKLGKEMELDEQFPAMFRATVRKGEDFSRIKVDMLNGVTVESCGHLTIRNIFLPRFIDRFGELVRFENEDES